VNEKNGLRGGGQGARRVETEIFGADPSNIKSATRPTLSKPGWPVPLMPVRGVRYLQIFGDGSERYYPFKPDGILTLTVQQLTGFKRTWTTNRSPGVWARPPGSGWMPEASNDSTTSWLRRFR
jgi:hypothetical protein